MQTLRVNNSRILRTKNAKFSGYYFYLKTNIQGDFQICISVPLNYFFLFVGNSDLSTYADGNTLYSSGNGPEKVKQTLRQGFEIVTKWFYENCMVLNLSKCHFISRTEHSE